ncbi:MAG: zinc-binding dehydrogenase [Bryobacteraceae bacterium]
MKAVQIHSHGGPEVLEYTDIPEPQLRADEVLVSVRAAALNHLDLFVRNGIPGAKFKFPHILGSDAAGEVVAAGELCRRVQPGQRVLLAPGLSCRQCLACLEGRDNECRSYTLLGTGLPGVNRELINVPEYAVIPIPDSLDYLHAAAAPLVYVTAWHMLLTRARLQPGEDVLVLAGSSGVGMAAIQLARWFHCRVIATAGSAEKMARCKELGASFVLNHHRDHVPAEVRKLTAKRGVDVVFEHVGSATWDRSRECLAPSGRLVTCGATTGYDVALDLRYLFSKQQSLLGSFMGTLGELHRVLRLVFDGTLRPVVDSVFPLTEIRAAHERLEHAERFGKVMLEL